MTKQTSLAGVDNGTFHKREAIAQRVGLAALTAFLLAGLLGLFGSGPISRASRRSADGTLEVRYERMTRASAPTTMRIHVSDVAPKRGPIRWWLSREFAEAIDIERVLPEPVRTSVGSERLDFEFATGPVDSAVSVIVTYRPHSLGVLSGHVGTGAGREVRFRQIVFP
ncbi:MAG: hypothetical protein ACT4R6_05575 [Gemmatimonadaceae bacterium]